MACSHLKRKCKIIRETDNRASGSITASIVRNTVDSDIAVVDITGMNPNVFFELGIRYALRRSTTILLRNQDSRIPFDVNVYRAISYRKLQFEAAAHELAIAVIHALTTQGGYCDSLVYDVFSNLEVRIPNVYDSGEASERGHSNVMPWSEFFQHIKDVVETLKDAVTNGRYQPDVILGISNGGLLVMDLLGRELHLHKPLLALWADRQAGLDMFDSDYNSATLEIIKSKNTSEKNKEKKLEVLLVDDIVATSQTIELAKKFLVEKLGQQANIRFLPLFNRSLKNREVLRGLLLYDDKRFQLNEEQAIRLMSTTRLILPYGKYIRE
jgi:hypoxanthine phosphoribosyltransferase